MGHDARRQPPGQPGDIRDPAYAERLAFEAPEEHMRRRDFLQRAAVTAGLGAGLAATLDPATLVAAAAQRQRSVALPSARNLPIDTFVVLMMENRSFDHYLGWMPKADGRQAGITYVDRNAKAVQTHHLTGDFQGCAHPDPDHGWDDGRIQLNNGHMDGFLRSSSNDEFAVGYYLAEDLGFLPALANTFTTYDRMFCSILASTYPNREYMHAAQSYGLKDNTLPPQTPSQNGFPDATIFASLAAAGVSNRYFYSDIPASALWGQPGVARSGPVSEYYQRCANGTLPALSFVDPSFANESGGTSGDEHPHGDIRVGQAFMSDVVHAFIQSPQYKRGALFIVYDEWGGFYDHVRPPRLPDDRATRKAAEDFGQTGFRIPAVVVSPYARGDYVSHSVYTPVSILKMIAYRYGLGPLNKRMAFAPNIARSFDWTSDPRLEPPSLPTPAHVAGANCPNRAPGPFRAPGAGPPRPKEHDLVALLTSGYLERLGFHYKPATPDRIFREPSRVVEAHRAASQPSSASE